MTLKSMRIWTARKADLTVADKLPSQALDVHDVDDAGFGHADKGGGKHLLQRCQRMGRCENICVCVCEYLGLSRFKIQNLAVRQDVLATVF